MRTKLYRVVVAMLVLAAVVSAGIAGHTTAQAQAAPIRLKSATFTPARGERPNLPQGWEIGGPVAGQRGYYLVQFRGPVEQAWKDQVSALGVDLLDYVPDFAFKVRMTPEQARQVQALGSVGWVGLFQPAFKIDLATLRQGQAIYKVRIERGANAAQAAAQIAQQVPAFSLASGIVTVVADAAQVQTIARVADVAWIEPYTLNEKHNEYGGSVIIGGSVAHGRGYNGSTQIAAVADTGLGDGTTAGAHPDIPSARIVAINNWPGVTDSCFQQIIDDGSKDVDSGHGTHVAGSVLSDGGVSGEGIGVAPAARLVFQATENYVITSNFCKTFYGYQNGYYLTGLPADLNQLFQQAYNQGARIHANSWGASVAGDYTANSAETDQFIWNNRDMAITFSAGNSGADANADGVVDNDSIGSPATAKNVITIGASENDRQGNYQCDTSLTYTSRDTSYQNGQTCSSMGGQNLLGTPRQRWGFTANPIADDPTAGNANQMAAFSSRGPTDDGRIKPDVVAPGTWILSTYAPLHQEGYGDPVNPHNNAYQSDGWGMPRNGQYKYFGGTSMSNPIAAGGATVVRDFYNKATPNASAALVKATLINSAVDLLDENNDGVNDNDFPIPNVHEGWGRVNLDNATDGTAQFVDNTTGLSTGGNASYNYDVTAGTPLKITLVWSDYPSTETATANLVNNLNLLVTAPDGTQYRGNVFSGGWSQTGGSDDTVNNVENVYIQAPVSGSWTVQISGANVPNGPQPFALVVDGNLTSAPPPPAPAAPSNLTATAASSSQINLGWTDNANNETGFKVERCQGAGCTSFAQIGTAAADATSYSDTGLSANTSYTYRVRATNAGGDSAYSNQASATTQAGPSNTGLLNPTANAAVTSGSGDNNGFQTNPANAHTDGGGVAVDTDSGNGTSTSCSSNRKDRHIYRDYNISPGATINGIEVRLDAFADSTSGTPRMCVQLSWDGGATWTAAKTSANLTTSEATYLLGGATDTWGRTWSSSNFSNTNFRVRITNIASSTARDFSLDWVAVRVYYQ